MRLSRRRVFSGDWARTLWAIADQCAVSGGNFLTNLIVARTLLPVEFGTYALVLNAMVFFNTIQQAIVAYPVIARGARSGAIQFRRILAFALLATVVLQILIFGPALSILSISFHRMPLVVAALCAMLLWQLQDTLRTGFIANLEQRRALVGDALSYGGQALLLGLMCSGTKPSLEAIFWTLGGTSLAALVVQIWQIRPLMPPRRVVGPLVCTFWTLGRWNVVAKLMGFLTLQAFPWLILMRHGRVEVAGFQVIFQFLAFINPLLYSMGSMVTATVAKTQSFRGSTVRNYLILTVAATSSYLLFLAVAGSFAMGALYGSHSHYVGYAPLMSIFAAAWFFEVIALLTTSILAGLGRPRGIFTVQLNGALAAVLIVLPWTYWKGLIAAALGMLLVNAVRASTGVVLLLGHREATPAPRPLRLSPDFSMDADVNEVTLGQQLGTTLQEEYVEP